MNGDIMISLTTFRSTRLRTASALVALAALTTTVAACGNSDSASDTKYGGDIEVGIFDTFPGFCVSNNPANSALMAARTVYETLFERLPNGEMTGLLARDATASDDLKTWTISLRDGITFHDGTAFNAEAVVTNFNAITGRIAAAAYAADGLAGLGTKSYTIGTATAFTANILAFEATNELTVVFTLDRPQNDFLATLYASGRFFMRSPAQLADSKTCAEQAVGTGPYTLKSWTTTSMVVEKNPTYWRTNPANGEALPYLDQITFTNVKESSQRAASVRSGVLTAAMFASGSEATFIKDLRVRADEVTEFRSPTEYYPSLWLNQGKPGSPFAEKSARDAVLSCLDRENYLKVRLGNEGVVAKSIVGSESDMYSTLNFPKYDVETAMTHVETYKDMTGKDSLSFVFPADTSSTSQANGRFLQNMWKECNIDAEMIVEETAVLISKAFNASPDLKKGQYYNAYDMLPLLVFEGNDVSFNLPFIVTNAYPSTSTNPVKPLFENSVGAVLGLTHHSDTQVDEFFYKGQAATTSIEAKARYADGTAYIQKNSMVGALAHVYYSVFVSPDLLGVGELSIESGKTQRVVTNWGIDWTGVYINPD
jgi:ABC-type transport system substrate-binding protein